MNFISYILFRAFIGLMKVIPFALLYPFSSILYFFFYRVFSYRKQIVRSNLTESFPSKSAKEIKSLEKKFFRHLSMITVESMKGYSLNTKQILKRYELTNPEIVEKYFSKGQDIIAIASHYGNWEWGIASVGLQTKHSCYALYMPMKNRFIEKFLVQKRAKDNMHLVSIYKTRELFQEEKEKPALYIMASDQSPSNMEKAIWFDLFNRKTPWLHGTESYSRRYNLPVVYFQVKKSAKGYYQLTIIDLAENPNELAENEITKRYVQQLEKDILEQPEYWLWSHRRWKRVK